MGGASSKSGDKKKRKKRKGKIQDEPEEDPATPRPDDVMPDGAVKQGFVSRMLFGKKKEKAKPIEGYDVNAFGASAQKKIKEELMAPAMTSTKAAWETGLLEQDPKKKPRAGEMFGTGEDGEGERCIDYKAPWEATFDQDSDSEASDREGMAQYERPDLSAFGALEKSLKEETKKLRADRLAGLGQAKPERGGASPGRGIKRATSSGLLISNGPKPRSQGSTTPRGRGETQSLPTHLAPLGSNRPAPKKIGDNMRSAPRTSSGLKASADKAEGLVRAMSSRLLGGGGDSPKGGDVDSTKLPFSPTAKTKKDLSDSEGLRFREDGRQRAVNHKKIAQEKIRLEDELEAEELAMFESMESDMMPVFKGNKTRRLIKEKAWLKRQAQKKREKAKQLAAKKLG